MDKLALVYFYACAAAAVLGALGVVVAKNPIRSAMGLLLLILSVAGLFLALHAQFLAAIQLIVYAGAIVVLFLFVIMLLGPSAQPPSDRRGVVMRTIGGGVFAIAATGGGLLVIGADHLAKRPPMDLPAVDPGFGGIDAFGSWLFSDALVPFELSSALLMVAVVGAVAVARGSQGVKGLTKAERQVAEIGLPPPAATGGEGGVFSHEIQGEEPGE